jgi:hypothetical protein
MESICREGIIPEGTKAKAILFRNPPPLKTTRKILHCRLPEADHLEDTSKTFILP